MIFKRCITLFCFYCSFLKLRTKRKILSIPALTKLFSQLIQFQENQMKCALQGFGKLRLQKWMEKKFHIENYAWSRKTPADQDELLTKFCRGPKPPMEYFVSKNYEFRIPKIALVKKKPGQKGRPAAEYTTKRPQKHMTKKKQTRYISKTLKIKSKKKFCENKVAFPVSFLFTNFTFGIFQ